MLGMLKGQDECLAYYRSYEEESKCSVRQLVVALGAYFLAGTRSRTFWEKRVTNQGKSCELVRNSMAVDFPCPGARRNLCLNAYLCLHLVYEVASAPLGVETQVPPVESAGQIEDGQFPWRHHELTKAADWSHALAEEVVP